MPSSIPPQNPPAPTQYTQEHVRRPLLNELIDYGGIPTGVPGGRSLPAGVATTRAEAILDMQRMGIDQGCIDRWRQGYEFGQRLRDRRARPGNRHLTHPVH